jgi:hypothetical protein
VIELDDELRRRLEREEQKAREKLLRARLDFNKVLADAPSTIPHPDGNLLIQKAGAEVRALNLKYGEANRRLMDYLVYGVVPEEKSPEEVDRDGRSRPVRSMDKTRD